MGAFYVINCIDAKDSARLRARVESSFAAQGFAAPQRRKFGRLEVGVYPKRCGADVQLYDVRGEGFAALAGTAIVHGTLDTAAQALWHGYDELGDTGAPEFSEWIGQFCALLARQGKLSLFLDPLGIYKVYRRRDARVFASSFLAVCATLDRPLIHPQGVFEYLFQEATYGQDTVIEDVLLARCGGFYTFDGEGAGSFTPWSLQMPDQVLEAPFETHVEACLGRLRFMFERIGRCFGDRIDTALSGGYDSRLMVALLREQGLEPSVHVYGASDARDVEIARRVAQAEGFHLDHVDKSTYPQQRPDRFSHTVEKNFLVFDGYPPSGIFDGGVDLATREERARGARLMLNGGGGEVFRNFFYLPDRRFTTREVVYSFYSQYDPAFTTDVFDEHDYLDRLALKIAHEVGVDGTDMSRLEVERIYPEFRCRYWMGRNNAVNNRFGYALTPFVDPLLERHTLVVPMAYKNHGILEAAMIRSISPSLARHESDYGHAFDGPPPLGRVLKDRATLLRPPWLRRYTYRLRHRKPSPRGRYLEPQYVSAVLDPALPIMARYVLPQRLHDPGVYQRACTLEYLFQRLDARSS